MLLLVTLAGLGVALLLGAFALALRRPRIAAGSAIGLVALLCGRAVLAARADWEWALFPWPGYAFVHGFVLYGLAAAFFGLAAATLPVRWNRAVVLAAGLGVLAHGVHRNAWMAWPEVHGDARVAGPDHHVRQSSYYTCGPAACVVQVIGDRPFDVSIEAVSAEQIVAEQLVVVGSNSGRGHALCIATSGGRLVVHDPLRPVAQRYSLQLLRDEFRPPAIVIRARAGADATPSR
ncbi:MAG: hypothetical protein MUC36_29400 [Planctomycetes bacterium]|nr:hypothetical protein [Planctomycetota bacterium]